MKIKIENLGIIKKAELELGKLTIICGENNTGKTYVTYALYGFLEKWHELMEIETPEKDIVTLMEKGTVDIDISPYIKKASDILKDCCNKYSKNLASVFASSEKYFESSQFSMDLDSSEIKTEENYDTNISSSKTTIFKISKGAGKSHIQITLLTEKENIDLPNFIIGKTISSSIKTVAFSNTLPRPFIASAERTGAAIFQKELDILKNRMLENIHGSKAIKPLELVLDTIKGYDYDYALPVKDNVDFVRNLSEISKKESFLQKTHPDVIKFFDMIVGGEFKITQNSLLFFVPKKTKSTKLTMGESSSSIRSLLIIGFYLRHTARPGDILIIDEPELNLHPKNQRLMARLFAKLANIGINVFITTHSDYIIKELNTLIMLNQDLPHIEKIMEEEGYQKDELIDVKDIRVYQAKEGLIRLSGALRQTRGNTLVPADIDQQTGIGIESFDDSIDEMNRIQEDVIFGKEN